jgi:hypothetical protein
VTARKPPGFGKLMASMRQMQQDLEELVAYSLPVSDKTGRIAGALMMWVDQHYVGRADDPNDIAREIRDAIDSGSCAPAEEADSLIGQLRLALTISQGACAELSACVRKQEDTDPTRDDVNNIARIMMAEWERVEHKPVNVSYISTFADMARAVLRAITVPILPYSEEAQAVVDRIVQENRPKGHIKRKLVPRNPVTFTEAEYTADPGKVIDSAAVTGTAVVARADGSPRVVISIPPEDLEPLEPLGADYSKLEAECNDLHSRLDASERARRCLRTEVSDLYENNRNLQFALDALEKDQTRL